MASFIQKYHDLRQSVPIPAVMITDNENCDYVDYTHYSKNCSFCFICQMLENGIYCDTAMGKYLVDCDRTVFSELCYECVRCLNCYNSTYSVTCHQSSDCHFCYDCIDCKNCFGCVALTRKQFCIFNQQLEEAEYQNQFKQLTKQSPQEINDKVNILRNQTPQPASHQFKNDNCPYGDFINESKNVYWAFDIFRAEEAGYLSQSGLLRDCWDADFAGGGGSDLSRKDELCYEMCGTNSNYHCAFLERSNTCRDCYYGSGLSNCKDCFGCVGLSNKQYCLLNNQLTQNEYLKAEKIIHKELDWREAN